MCVFSSLEPLKMDSAAYPFLAFSGIPSVSFRFTSHNSVSWDIAPLLLGYNSASCGFQHVLYFPVRSTLT